MRLRLLQEMLQLSVQQWLHLPHPMETIKILNQRSILHDTYFTPEKVRNYTCAAPKAIVASIERSPHS